MVVLKKHLADDAKDEAAAHARPGLVLRHAVPVVLVGLAICQIFLPARKAICRIADGKSTNSRIGNQMAAFGLIRNFARKIFMCKNRDR